jgi:RNA polymerase sigma factor (sigma-70 family)
LVGQDDELPDIVQESMRVALERFDTLREPRQFSIWLSHVVLSTAHRILRRRKLRERIGDLPNDVPSWEELPSHLAQPQLALEISQIQRALLCLPERERAVLVRRRIDAETVGDIARALQTSESSVKRWLARAERSLGRAVGVRIRQS